MTFNCDICNKKYDYYSSLENHIKKVHAEPKKFNCEKCEKDFDSLKRLTAHVKYAHDKVFESKCDKCETAFSMDYSNKHKECGFCGKSFNYMYDARSHVQKAHLEPSLDPKFVFAFDSDNSLSMKKEIKEEVLDIQGEVSFCNIIKTEDQTLEIEKLRQSYEALKKKLEQSLTENDSLRLENDSLAQKLSSVKEELMTMKENHF